MAKEKGRAKAGPKLPSEQPGLVRTHGARTDVNHEIPEARSLLGSSFACLMLRVLRCIHIIALFLCFGLTTIALGLSLDTPSRSKMGVQTQRWKSTRGTERFARFLGTIRNQCPMTDRAPGP